MRASRTPLVTVLVLLAGCGGLTESKQLPPGVRGPAEIRTPEGALAAYHGVRYEFREALADAVPAGALLTDEFGSNSYGQPVLGQPTTFDRRYLPENMPVNTPENTPGVTENRALFQLLHHVRRQANEAIGLLTQYAPELSPALRAHAYALAGYAEVLLADLYCSGIPLSTLDFNGDFTYRPGSSTTEVYEHALALFDTALTLAADSTRLLHFAQVGRGRALLALGQYAAAGEAVTAVLDGFSYSTLYDGDRLHTHVTDVVNGEREPFATMTDGDGGGLLYRSSGDPRVAAVEWGENNYGSLLYLPAKYRDDGTGPIVVADWVEARLIEAEAALQAGDTVTWLVKLNHLRRTAWTTIQPAIDTALSDLADPGTAEARVDLTFRERAFWLFLTGHRQGDARRLVRVYRRSVESVYPSGTYADGYGVYGSDVTLPVPSAERQLNPHYTGCRGRGA